MTQPDTTKALARLQQLRQGLQKTMAQSDRLLALDELALVVRDLREIAQLKQTLTVEGIAVDDQNVDSIVVNRSTGELRFEIPSEQTQRKESISISADSDAVLNQRKLLNAHRRTLNKLLVQRADHSSAYAPPSVLNGIDQARAEIAGIKAWLVTQGETVEDAPEDGDEERGQQPPTANAPPTQSQQEQKGQVAVVSLPTRSQHPRRDLAWWASVATIIGVVITVGAWLWPDPINFPTTPSNLVLQL